MMSPTHKRKLNVNGGATGSPKQAGDGGVNSSPGKSKKNGDKSVMSSFRKRGSIKSESSKVDSTKRTDAPGTPTRFGGRMPSLTKSSSAYFPNSVSENGVKSPAAATGQKSGRGGVSGIKGIWRRSSRKKTAKIETEDWVDVGGTSDQSPVREMPRKLSLRRKNSISGDKVGTIKA